MIVIQFRVFITSLSHISNRKDKKNYNFACLMCVSNRSLALWETLWKYVNNMVRMFVSYLLNVKLLTRWHKLLLMVRFVTCIFYLMFVIVIKSRRIRWTGHVARVRLGQMQTFWTQTEDISCDSLM